MSKKIIAIFIVISIIVSFYSGLLHCFADYLIETDILKNEDSAIEQYNRLLQEFTNISGIIDYPNVTIQPTPAFEDSSEQKRNHSFDMQK